MTRPYAKSPLPYAGRPAKPAALKRYHVTIERKDGSHHDYQFFAKDRKDAEDFVKRVNKHNFKRLVSARAESPTPRGQLTPEQKELYTNVTP